MAHDYDYERDRYGRSRHGRFVNERYNPSESGSYEGDYYDEPYYRGSGSGRYYNEPYWDRSAEGYYSEPYGRYDSGRYEYRRRSSESRPGDPYRRESGYEGRFGESYDRGRYGRATDDRGFLERAGDEIKSWFGDEEAERRRRLDEMRMGGHAGRGPRNYRRSDERIREDVNERLTDDPYLDATGVEVTVNSCEVTLIGTVNNRYDKRRAADLAESVSGVTDVHNQLRVNQDRQDRTTTLPDVTDTPHSRSART